MDTFNLLLWTAFCILALSLWAYKLEDGEPRDSTISHLLFSTFIVLAFFAGHALALYKEGIFP